MHIEQELFYFPTDLRHTGSVLTVKDISTLRLSYQKTYGRIPTVSPFSWPRKKDSRHVYLYVRAHICTRYKSRDGFFHNPRALLPFSPPCAFPRNPAPLFIATRSASWLLLFLPLQSNRLFRGFRTSPRRNYHASEKTKEVGCRTSDRVKRSSRLRRYFATWK